MKTKMLKSEQEYDAACKRIYNLINESEVAIDPDSPEGEEVELLSLLVEKFEKEHYPIHPPTPIGAIIFRMDQMNLRQVDIAPLFGGKTRVSEVLHGKRPLTLKMITLLNRYLGIPLESLVAGNENVELDPELRDKLLSNTSIKDYFLKASY